MSLGYLLPMSLGAQDYIGCSQKLIQAVFETSLNSQSNTNGRLKMVAQDSREAFSFGFRASHPLSIDIKRSLSPEEIDTLLSNNEDIRGTYPIQMYLPEETIDRLAKEMVPLLGTKERIA